MKSAIASAPAKVNLVLKVGAQDEQGYHDLVTVFQGLSLREYVVAELVESVAGQRSAGNTPGVTTHVYSVAPGEEPVYSPQLSEGLSALEPASHLAVRAAKALGASGAVHLTVHKMIPVAGGMAGGSADAAAALTAVNALLDRGLAKEQLEKIGRTLGADVPACLTGAVSLGTGRGDHMRLLRTGSNKAQATSNWWALVFFEEGLSTPEVFKEFDQMMLGGRDKTPLQMDPGDQELLSRPLSAKELAPLLQNDLQPAALNLRSDLEDVGKLLVQSGAETWIVSGSGPTVAGLVADRETAIRLARSIGERGIPGVRGTAVAWGPACGSSLEERLPIWATGPKPSLAT